jgi:hypothetical protein
MSHGNKTIDARYLAAISIDDRGEVTPLYPETVPATWIFTTTLGTDWWGVDTVATYSQWRQGNTTTGTLDSCLF